MKSRKQRMDPHEQRAAGKGLELKAALELKLARGAVVVIAGGIAAILWAIAKAWV